MCKNLTMWQTLSNIQIQSLLTQISPRYPVLCVNMSNLWWKLSPQSLFRMGSFLKISQRENNIWKKRERILSAAKASKQQCYTVACVTLFDVIISLYLEIYRQTSMAKEVIANFTMTDREEYHSRFCLGLPSCFVKLRQGSRRLSDTC